MPSEEQRVIRVHLEPGPDGVTLTVTEAASASAPGTAIVEATTIVEPTVVEVEA
jgi:hypothetical protein